MLFFQDATRRRKGGKAIRPLCPSSKELPLQQSQQQRDERVFRHRRLAVIHEMCSCCKNWSLVSSFQQVATTGVTSRMHRPLVNCSAVAFWIKQTRRKHLTFPAVIILVLWIIVDHNTRRRRADSFLRTQVLQHYQILLVSPAWAPQSVQSTSLPRILEQHQAPDFNGLQIQASSATFPLHDEELHGPVYNETMELTIPYVYWHADDLEGEKSICRRPPWADWHAPNCNEFHLIDLSRDYQPGVDELTDVDTFLISQGFYRDVWVHSQPSLLKSVLKTTRYRFPFDYRNLMDVQREAMVMERLAKAPNVVNLYGHCASSIWAEAVSYEVEEYVVPGTGYRKRMPGESVASQNSLPPDEKLQMATEMAKSLAMLHGHDGGVIVHTDVQLSQWMRTKDNVLKLVDLNSARVLEWNDQTKEYCSYSTGTVFGNFRSPEEFAASTLDERVDVYSFGNVIYGLLTGLWPFFENQDDTVVHEKVLSGERPYVDPLVEHSPHAEDRRLVEIMKQCWRTKDRVDIFQVLAALKEDIT